MVTILDCTDGQFPFEIGRSWYQSFPHLTRYLVAHLYWLESGTDRRAALPEHKMASRVIYNMKFQTLLGSYVV